MSDSHPETLTDPEHSDQAGVTSSPPQSGDEVKLAAKEKGAKEPGDRRSKLFNKENYKAGGQQVLDRFSQTIKTRQADKQRDRETGHGFSNSYKVRQGGCQGQGLSGSWCPLLAKINVRVSELIREC